MQALAAQEVGGLLHPAPRQTIDDARIAGVLLAQEAQQLATRLVLLDHAIPDVGPIKAGDELLGLRQTETFDDLLAGQAIGGGGEGDARDPGPALMQQVELDVLGPEVVPPLRDAVGLVDGKEGDAALVQQGQKAFAEQPLRGYVQQVELAGHQALFHRPRLPRGQGGVEKGRPQAELVQGVHLVLHQGDEGRDDDAGAGPHQGRNLEAEGLAAARGHEDQGIAASDDPLDDPFLGATKVRIAEDPAQQVEGTGRRRRGHRRGPGLISGGRACGPGPWWR
jgi:hypothetical protein